MRLSRRSAALPTLVGMLVFPLDWPCNDGPELTPRIPGAGNSAARLFEEGIFSGSANFGRARESPKGARGRSRSCAHSERRPAPRLRASPRRAVALLGCRFFAASIHPYRYG